MGMEKCTIEHDVVGVGCVVCSLQVGKKRACKIPKERVSHFFLSLLCFKKEWG